MAKLRAVAVRLPVPTSPAALSVSTPSRNVLTEVTSVFQVWRAARTSAAVGAAVKVQTGPTPAAPIWRLECRS